MKFKLFLENTITNNTLIELLNKHNEGTLYFYNLNENYIEIQEKIYYDNSLYEKLNFKNYQNVIKFIVFPKDLIFWIGIDYNTINIFSIIRQISQELNLQIYSHVHIPGFYYSNKFNTIRDFILVFKPSSSYINPDMLMNTENSYTFFYSKINHHYGIEHGNIGHYDLMVVMEEDYVLGRTGIYAKKHIASFWNSPNSDEIRLSINLCLNYLYKNNIINNNTFIHVPKIKIQKLNLFNIRDIDEDFSDQDFDELETIRKLHLLPPNLKAIALRKLGAIYPRKSWKKEESRLKRE